jgi:hypothetical protein
MPMHANVRDSYQSRHRQQSGIEMQSQTVLPAQQIKVIHLVRHAQVSCGTQLLLQVEQHPSPVPVLTLLLQAMHK